MDQRGKITKVQNQHKIYNKDKLQKTKTLDKVNKWIKLVIIYKLDKMHHKDNK